MAGWNQHIPDSGSCLFLTPVHADAGIDTPDDREPEAV